MSNGERTPHEHPANHPIEAGSWDPVRDPDPRIPPGFSQGRILLASDFDGTLAPIVAKPSDARADPDALDALLRLSRIPQVVIAVVSGRSLRDLEILCREFPSCWRVGDHGRSLQDPRGRIFSGSFPTKSDKRLGPVGLMAVEISHRYEGILVERKEHGVALHFRNTSDSSRRELGSALDSWIASAQATGLHAMRGREVVEIQVPGEGKLPAILRVARLEHCDSMVFGGDDTTDLDTVRFLSNSGNGCGIWVRSQERSIPEFPPDFIVNGPTGWAAFLHALADHLENRA